MASSLATYVHNSIGFYLAICLVGAAIVLAHQMTAVQRFIGWIFIAMAGLNVGYLAGVQNSLSPANGLSVLADYQHLLGWSMVAALFWWGGYDLFRRVRIAHRINQHHHADSVEPST